MANFITPQVDQLRIITATQLPWKTGLCKLFKEPIEFLPGIVSADLAAIEADFSGYAAKTETTLPLPYPDFVNGGVSFQVPTLQYQVASPATIGNSIYGGWFEDAGGLLLMAWQLESPQPMTIALQVLFLDLILNQGGSNQLYVLINGVPR